MTDQVNERIGSYMGIKPDRIRNRLREMDFKSLFIEELGWSQPSNKRPTSFEVKQQEFSRKQVAELSGVVVFEVTSHDGEIPDAKMRREVHKVIAQLHHENILIFIDKQRTQCIWYWVKRESGKWHPREHLYVQGQPGDLFISKLAQIVFDLSEFDDQGNVSLIEVSRRVKDALDIERVTKKFFGEYQQQQLEFVELIKGIDDDGERRWYASVLLNRLMFIYFLQKKPPGFIDNGNLNYLREKLQWSKMQGKNQFFKGFLRLLFFEGFAKPQEHRSPEARRILGDIRYLDGGLFLPHRIENPAEYPKLDVPDEAFDNLFTLFERYSWNLDDTPGGNDNEINPDVLGYIFEKHINQKQFGAYYTRPEITEYLCHRTIHQLILNQVNEVSRKKFESLGDVLLGLDKLLCKRLLLEILPKLSILDPACGSGAFLVAAMKTLIDVYAAVIGKIKFLPKGDLSLWLEQTEREHPNIQYFIKKTIITNNLYGVDIMEEATEIAKLRLFLALVASAQKVDDLEPLPNVDFNIMPGNSLIGLMRVDDAEFEKRNSQGNLFRKSYREILLEKNRLIDNFRKASTYAEDLAATREHIAEKKREAYETLDEILADQFTKLGIKYEEATWDAGKGKQGKSSKRSIQIEDIESLTPFHWGYEFDQIFANRDGFDAIITNPPWEIFKPNSKEFFEEYSDVVSKKKMTIHDFEEHQGELLRDRDIRAAWLDYLSSFPHQSAWYRSSDQYKNQISIVNDRKAGSDINLYKLFTEQCFNLLRPGGLCGLVIPSGIYTDLGTKQLREMLFGQTRITGLFGFENRKMIFEGVDSRFKFVVLSFEKGGQTESFPARFMRHQVSELESFPGTNAIVIPTTLVKKLSPDSLSVMEFKSDIDVTITIKMLESPLLGEDIKGMWKIRFYREFDMTNDSDLFESTQCKGRLPLFEGKMIWHFDHQFAKPRYWIDERAGRKQLLNKSKAEKEKLAHQQFRMGFRDVAASTNERSAISTMIPPNNFAGNTMPTNGTDSTIELAELTCFVAVFNSFVFDWLIRTKITNHLNFFYLYQMPVPRLSAKDKLFKPIVTRAAKLICTTPEFDELAKEVGLKSHKDGVTDEAKRGRLRAELDGIIAHLYGLTEAEFQHVLSTFPLVPDPVKIAAHNAYRDYEKGLIK